MIKKRLTIIVSAVAIVLIIPLAATQYTDEVTWNRLDFVVMGFMLLGVGLSCEFAMRKLPNKRNRLAVIAIILLVFILFWAELSVGIIRTPFAGS